MDIIQYINENAILLDNHLEQRLFFPEAPTRLMEALRYGVIGGGKKLRASLCLATGEAYGIKREDLLSLAGGIEMIHSFSLVHDDLPEMDNDDYRRGKYSLHKAFGGAMGILAGDALLVEGFRFILSDSHFCRLVGNTKLLKILNVLLDALSVEGMVGGQVLDIDLEGTEADEEQVMDIYRMKTARFIQAPILCGAIVGGVNKKELNDLERFGLLAGECFQIKDDLLDVTQPSEILGKTAGKDVQQEKATLVKIYGIHGTQEIMENLFREAEAILNQTNRSFSLLREIAHFIITRHH
ncbi:MAG: polyprenyl synthetase family protein [Atribacterota bacterium]|jgi:geranylgeranyl diphosphate synthase type II|uniref:polyprenyl synthetase family protein n=2 Tax=Atribacter sp. TaxID=2847780 RepID=UPI001774256D|nr:polyprenyl synthetase family protein [Atribacterota bacterium]MDI9595726.1 polyprenyl synthetase family protein [Atribacterota bacterium]HHT11384.1 polyprenyl synthetase family protein [Candidatus Atribacteria bacterium]HOT04848.1 polyprenyl synthetase family protein [Atribacter sp.]